MEVSPQHLSDTTGVPAVPEGAQVATLEEIKAKIKSRQVSDLSQLPTHHHALLGMVYIAPLSTTAYAELEATEAPLPAWANPEAGTSWPPQGEKLRSSKRMQILLGNGVLTADGKKLDDEVVAELMKGDCGAETKRLTMVIQKHNPPSYQLVGEFAQMYGHSRFLQVFMEVTREAGLWGKLIEYLTAADDNPKAQEGAQALKKVEEALPYFTAVLDAKDAAGKIGVALPFGVGPGSTPAPPA
jgi:hypothetical protein